MAFFRDGNDPVDLGEALAIRQTEKGLLVACGPVEFWVPKSAIHERSEVRDCDAGAGPGKLVLKKWFARKENLL